MSEQTSIFIDYAKNLLEKDPKKINAVPLKDHPQLPLILDTLSRYEQHHVVITHSDSKKINGALLEGLAQHILSDHLPKTLRQADFIYFDVARFALAKVSREQIEMDFKILINHLNTTSRRIIFAVDEIEPFAATNHPNLLYLGQLLQTFLTDDQWRFIIINQPNQSFPTAIAHHFCFMTLKELNSTESLGLLKSFRTQLENFHHIMISDETFASAYTMANHYLPGQTSLDKALQLLDSGAARASVAERSDQSGHKPVLTSNLLAQVVSSWTQIPLANLQQNKFQATKLVDVLRKQIFGQEAAINLVAVTLQNACVKLHEQKGPLCSFLFVGPSDVGKTEMAKAIAAHLFEHKDALLQVNLPKGHCNSLSDIKINFQGRSTNLLEAIKQTPYAVILMEKIDQAPSETLELFKDIFTQGYVIDEQDNKYDFRHTIIIMTTKFASEQITKLSSTPTAQEATRAVDLMQLVLNDHLQESASHTPHMLSAQELCEEIIPQLESHFSISLLHQVNIVPFIPLDYAALEKIIRIKIKALARRLDAMFGTELSYAPEIIKFLAHEFFWRNAHTKSLDKLLDNHLYSCVTHEILSHAEDKNRPKRLLLQLNDSGQLLRCEFVAAGDTTLYKL